MAMARRQNATSSSRLRLAAAAKSIVGMSVGARKSATRSSLPSAGAASRRSIVNEIHSERMGGRDVRFHHKAAKGKGFVAAHEGYAEFVARSVRKINAEDSSPSGKLCAAALQGDARGIAQLVARGANLNWNARLQMNPLQLAMHAHQFDAAHELLHAGADPRFVAAGARGWEASALHTACQNDATEDGRFVELLLQWGAAPLLISPSYNSVYSAAEIKAQVRGGATLKCALRTAAELRPVGALSALQRYGWMRRKWVDMSCAATGNTGWSTWWIEAACVTWSGAGAKREVHRAGTRHPAIGSLEALEAAERNGAKAKAVAREALVAR